MGWRLGQGLPGGHDGDPAPEGTVKSHCKRHVCWGWGEVIVTILALIYAFWVMLSTYHSLEIEKLHGGVLPGGHDGDPRGSFSEGQVKVNSADP
jgi:hypothetical protein